MKPVQSAIVTTLMMLSVGGIITLSFKYLNMAALVLLTILIGLIWTGLIWAMVFVSGLD